MKIIQEMQYPKISIVTPNYNKAQFLEKTILSVLSQGYPNLEYIIIDGGSTDGSVDIIKKYADQLTYWVSESDQGMYYAIRKGFEHATGEIMAWINSDDMYHPNAFFNVAQIFTDCPYVSWLQGAKTHYDELDRTVAVYQSVYFKHLDFVMHNYKFVQQESTFWRRELYDKAGGIQCHYRLAGDFDLWMRFSRHEKMFISNALIGGFRHSSDQLSSDMERYLAEAEDIIANEPISEEEKKQIRRLHLKDRLIPFLWIFKILNWQSIEKRFLRSYEEEKKAHCIYFDYNQKKFLTQR